MKAYGNPPVYEQRGHVEYPKAQESQEVLCRSVHAAATVLHERKKVVERERQQLWLEMNPDFVKRWSAKFGVVAAWGGFRIYYGTCQDCKGLVTARRAGIAGHMQGGRWPKYCPRCRENRCAAHNGVNARRRMRELRARQGSSSRYYRERRKAREQGLDPDDV